MLVELLDARQEILDTRPRDIVGTWLGSILELMNTRLLVTREFDARSASKQYGNWTVFGEKVLN